MMSSHHHRREKMYPFTLPSLKDESFISYQALIAKLAGNGALLEQYRSTHGHEPSTVGGVELSEFLTTDLSITDIENLAKQVGDDAAIGRAVRKLFARGTDSKKVGRILHRHFTLPT